MGGTNRMHMRLLDGKMMVVLAVALVLLIAVTVGVAEEERTDASGQWKYTLKESGVTLIGYGSIEPAGDQIIPNELDGHPVTEISCKAFQWCTDLTSIVIPASVTRISGNFWNCSLASITVSPDHPVFECVDGVLFNKENKSLIVYPSGRKGEYTIPDGTQRINYAAFSGCHDLTGVTIPSSVASIGLLAFNGCRGLTSVIIPDGVQEISSSAFSSCSNLAIVSIPRDTAVGGKAFDFCRNLTLIVEKGSPAETHAKKYKIPYVYMDEEGVPPADMTPVVVADGEGDTLTGRNRSNTFPAYSDEYEDVRIPDDDELAIDGDWHPAYDEPEPAKEDGWEPFDAVLNQRMATRTGPGTKFTEDHGTLPKDTEIVVYAQEIGGSVNWALVEFVKNGKLIRAYTGVKRIDADFGAIPTTTRNPESATITTDTTAYYGPGEAYLELKGQAKKGKKVQVYGIDRGFALIEYVVGDSWMRSWVPEECLAFE